jgi:hypothetical protein
LVSQTSNHPPYLKAQLDVPTNPDVDGQTVDPESVLPGPVAGVQLLYHIALGGPQENRLYIDAYLARFGTRMARESPALGEAGFCL